MMKQPTISLVTALILTALASCKATHTAEQHPRPCSEDWYPWVEAALSSGDGRGHGPDIGSDEWQSVIEFKLGVRGKADTPTRSSTAWCKFIDQLITERPYSDPIKSTVPTKTSPGTTNISPEQGTSP